MLRTSVIVILALLLPACALAQARPDTITVVRTRGWVGPHYTAALSRNGRVQYRSDEPGGTKRTTANWDISQTRTDSLWSAFAELGIDSIVAPNQRLVRGCDTFPTDQAGFGIIAMVGGERHSAFGMAACRRFNAPDSIPQAVSALHQFIVMFERLTGSLARWRTDNPNSPTEPPNKQLLQTPHTLEEGAHVLRHARQP